MKKFYKILIVTAVFFMLFANSVFAMGDYVIDKDSKMPIPETYTVKKVIKNLDSLGTLNNPEDLFIDSNGILYVADAGNNRIVKMDKEGHVLEAIIGPKEKPFNKPTGVFVDKLGAMYVADTGNSRVVRRSSSGQYDKTYIKPDSNMLSKDFNFDVRKISLSSTGILYVLKSSTFMTIDDNNRFLGYVGAKEVGFDLRRMLIRLFASRDQRDRIAKVLPVSYSNFVIGNDGLIYATVMNADKGQIRKLNSVGKNLYPDLTFGEKSVGNKGVAKSSSFTDIAVDKNGVISVIDQNMKRVYQYDTEGNLLLSFGTLREGKGAFEIPSSIVTDDSGCIYISDSKNGNIQVFEPTNFTSTIHKAVNLYNNGNYLDARKYWEDVLKIDANYSLAHQGMGKLYLKEGNLKESMEEYLLAEDKEGYSKAFKEYRHKIFREDFFIVFIVVIAISVALYYILVWFIGKANRVINKLLDSRGGA